MQSVEIEKQQSRRLVSGDSLYHSLEYLALTFSPLKRLLIKKKKTAYIVHHLTWDHYIVKL